MSQNILNVPTLGLSSGLPLGLFGAKLIESGLIGSHLATEKLVWLP